MYSANLIHNVSLTGFYNKELVDNLFNLSYENQVPTIPSDTNTSVVLIELKHELVYSYGFIVVSFYFTFVPTDVIVEMSTREKNETYTWKTIPRYTLNHTTNVIKTTSGDVTNNQWAFYNSTYYKCNKIRITINTSQNEKGKKAVLNQIAFYGIRMELSQSPLLTKYLDINIPHLNVTAKKYVVKNGAATQFLKGDGSLDSNSYAQSSHSHYIGTTKVQSSSTNQALSGITSISCTSLTSTGEIKCSAITETSDIRNKTNINKLKLNYTNILNNFNPVVYSLNTDSSNTALIGLIAQEVEEYLPNLVHTDDNGYKSIEYSKLGVISLACIKEMKNEIHSLKEKITDLENKIKRRH